MRGTEGNSREKYRLLTIGGVELGRGKLRGLSSKDGT